MLLGPTAINVFVALATRSLQATPDGTIPTFPPDGTFEGDAITLPTAPDPAGAGITFTASGANAPDVVTEILLQRLPTPN